MGKFFVASVLVLLSMTAVAQNRILIVGDSISAGYGLDSGQEWAVLLQKTLQAEQLNYDVVNASISGDTTAGGLARIEKLLADHKPQWVLIELGANDGLRGLSPKEMKQNLAQSILLSQQSGAAISNEANMDALFYPSHYCADSKAFWQIKKKLYWQNLVDCKP